MALLFEESYEEVMRAGTAELRARISPSALLSRSGWRRHSRVRPDELRQVAVPTLTVWGEQDLLASSPAARAVTELIPHAQMEVLPTGTCPWLGQPARAAATIAGFLR